MDGDFTELAYQSLAICSESLLKGWLCGQKCLAAVKVSVFGAHFKWKFVCSRLETSVDCTNCV